jgi:hypothetical protein
MTTRVKRPPIQWAFIPSGEMCLQLGVSADTLKDWRVAGVLKKDCTGLLSHTFPVALFGTATWLGTGS